MRELPAEWRWIQLKDVCKPDKQIIQPFTAEAKSLTYLSLEHIESETGRVLKEPLEESEDSGNSTTFRFDTRHVLYGKLRPYLNKVAAPSFGGRCTTELVPLLPDESIDRQFLVFALRRSQIVEAVMRDKTGSRMPRADMEILLNEFIPLPPLAEQKRIAAILTDQLAAVERARKAAEEQFKAINALPAAILSQAFTGNL